MPGFDSAMFTFASLSALPLPIILPIPLFALFTGAYLVAAPYFPTEKQRAYILSTFTSAAMTLMSLPFVWNYLAHGFRVSHEEAQGGWRWDLALFGVILFGTYLFADLALGYFKYPSQIGLLTGWIHHGCYIALMMYLPLTRHSSLFLIAGIMELPTFDLAISHLYPQVRNDFRFLTSFFLIRILFHAVVFLDCARPSSRAVTDGSYLPAIMYALAGFLHVSWFRGGLNGYVKRQRVAKSAVADPTLHEPILDTAVEVDSTVLEGLPSMVPGAVTPDDSPIITPYTPSQTPMSLRDSYVFPTIVMPTMPNLTAMSIPAIPSISDITAAFPKSLHSEHLSFGFKDAVRTRWDEQRGNFAGMGQRGREMALNLGGLGMRRRGTAVSSDDGEEVASRLEARG